MRLRDLPGLVLTIAVVLVSPVAQADSWRLPTTTHATSADGTWRFTVEPRVLSNQGSYFRDQLDGKEKPGGLAGDAQTAAVGTMERCVDGACRRAWRRDLLNDVAPVEAVVTDEGRVMTLDNWHSMGFGPHAVVIYDASGGVVATFALTDFLPKGYVMALPHSVSSLHWRDEARALAGGTRIAVPVVVPSEAADAFDDDTQYVDVVFDTVTGRATRPPPHEWARAVQLAKVRLAAIREEAAAEYRRFVEPLHAPAPSDPDGWHAYLREAFLRLDRGGKDGGPTINVLRRPGTPRAADSDHRMRAALRAARGDRGAIVLGSPSPEALAALLDDMAGELSPGDLAGSRLYLALDDARFAHAGARLAALGATLVQVDPAKAIPQRRERLAEFEDPAAIPDDDVLFD
jgi:hypothetical protein